MPDMHVHKRDRVQDAGWRKNERKESRLSFPAKQDAHSMDDSSIVTHELRLLTRFLKLDIQGTRSVFFDIELCEEKTRFSAAAFFNVLFTRNEEYKGDKNNAAIARTRHDCDHFRSIINIQRCLHSV